MAYAQPLSLGSFRRDMSRISIAVASWDYDRVRAISDGRARRRMRRQLSSHAGGSSKDWHLESGPLRVPRHLVPARKRRIGVGTYGAFARSKGAPIRAIGNQTTGAHALYLSMCGRIPRSAR
jgi:hypothetical protein